MSEADLSDLPEARPAAGAGAPEDGTAADPLAKRLLDAQRVLASLAAGSQIRDRLTLRFTAICTALKTPGTSRASCALRLNRLIADAERELARSRGGSGNQV